MSFVNRELLEVADICQAFLPVDIHTGANNGTWFPMRDFHRLTIVVNLAAGTASDQPAITVQQGKGSAGSSNKALNFTRVRKKDGSDSTSTSTTLPATWTLAASSEISAGVFTPAGTHSDRPAIYVIEIDGQSLDSYNGFDHVQVSIAAVSNSRIGSAHYLGNDCRHPQAIQTSDQV